MPYARTGVRRTVSSSSNESLSNRNGTKVRQTNRISKRRPSPDKKRPTLLYGALVVGLTLCCAELWYVFRYIGEKKAEEPQRMPEVVQKDASDADDGVIPPGDGDDRAPKLPALDIFAHPIRERNREEETKASDPVVHEDADKQPLIDLLKEAGVSLDATLIERLPTWAQVSALYGSEPRVYGLDQCDRFQKMGDPAEHFVSTAGTFNTGTNLLAELLIHNCHMPERMKKHGARSRGVRWQVLWGKHTPVGDEEFRLHHRTYEDPDLSAPNMFPAVTIRDPFKWMQSMCRHHYGAHWDHNKTHCPNLVPNEEDLRTFSELLPGEGVPVKVVYKMFNKTHDSLADFWNVWYQEYVNAPFPRLIVRFEDVIFHPKAVTKMACECAGGELNRGQFRYVVDSAKKGNAHGRSSERTSYVDALIKYGSEEGRYTGMDRADLEYARDHLDKVLMDMFGYKYPPESVSPLLT